jgi:phosphoenolpyruvate---glycerone phosphotransferase subunit DhaL
MEQKPLDTLATRDALVFALTTLSSNNDYLNHLDQALGDGDHGSTVARGSDAAIRDLQARTFATVNQEFETIGSAMMNSMGGASGILFGVLFRSAKNCQPSEIMNAVTLALFLRRGLDELKRKSQAAVGDKTMMDALAPAVDALEAKQGEPLEVALRAAAEAARQGATSTIGMLARFGRATALGERVRTAQDPGATSIALFLESLTTAAEKYVGKNT